MHKDISSCKKYPHNADIAQTLLSYFNTTNKEEGDSSSTISTWRFNQDVTRQLLADYVIIKQEPFRKVKQLAFKRLLSSMHPLWNNISRHMVAKDVVKIFNCEKVTLKNNLCNLKSRIALTTDIWNFIQNISYLYLTGHYIDKRWVLHKRILSFVPISSYRGREIRKVVEKCIHDWGIEKQVSYIAIDNANANDVAIVCLRESLADRSDLILNGKCFHMRCTAHIMNLIVKDDLSESRDCISQICNSVKYVRSSLARAEAFQRCVKEERITYKGGLCLNVVTRWNSTFLMLDDA
ncbi:hypothetical protein Patl1_15976 [Pistacia atlantica]|uniref:Uncharacterized protein n=1 Tax=Pistacia atlantica TaxID=434234 RepID=A0ACC1B681_9ROSI|nr:hypothetical protein Patl1_15976 [Pistacia atlantica]